MKLQLQNVKAVVIQLKQRYSAHFLARFHAGQGALQVFLSRRTSTVAHRLSIGVKFVISIVAYLPAVIVRDWWCTRNFSSSASLLHKAVRSFWGNC